MDKYNRALEILDHVCIGCSHCMKVCPTEALRVSGGKAVIHSDWCIDCGECYRVCPTRAIRVMDDDFSQIYNYGHRLLLIPSLFFAQFDETIPRQTIYSIIAGLGFDEIAVVEQSVDTLIEHINDYLEDTIKPVISSFCPAVVRLIQVRFPSLVDNIMRMKPPTEITAQYYRRKYEEEGVVNAGIFYLTPCIGKIASVKSPQGGYTSPINGVINMDYFYNKVYLAYKNKLVSQEPITVNDNVSCKGALYPTTSGESMHIRGRTLAVDGMHNVIDFLELLEDDEIKNVDFLELRVCDQSCAGGILSNRNRFLVAESLRKYAKKRPPRNPMEADFACFSSSDVRIGRIEPRSMVKYDRDISAALQKMQNARRLKRLLPDIDCGACGAPSCEALAEDIARDQAEINSCIFLRTMYEKHGEAALQDAIGIMEKIWGKDRFSNRRK